jgi:hypothetical protein
MIMICPAGGRKSRSRSRHPLRLSGPAQSRTRRLVNHYFRTEGAALDPHRGELDLGVMEIVRLTDLATSCPSMSLEQVSRRSACLPAFRRDGLRCYGAATPIVRLPRARSSSWRKISLKYAGEMAATVLPTLFVGQLRRLFLPVDRVVWSRYPGPVHKAAVRVKFVKFRSGG